MPIKLDQRLFIKQALATLVLAITLSLAAGAVRFADDLTAQRLDVQVHFQGMLALVNEPAEQAAYRLDDVFAAQIVHGLMKDPAVYRAELSEESGEMLAHNARGQLHSAVFALAARWLLPDVERFSHTLVHEATGREVGQLAIWIDTQVLVANFLDRTFRAMALTLGKDLLLAGLISLLFYFLVTRPLQTMTSSLIENELDLSRPLPLTELRGHRQDELGALGAAFNQLWRKLQDAMRALERSDAYSNAIISQAGDALLLCDAEGNIRRANREATRLLGHDEDLLKSLHLRQLHAFDTWIAFSELLDRLESGMPVTTETLYKTHGGLDSVPVEIRLIKYDQQGDTQLLLLVRDVTERKAAEARINHLAYYDSLTELPNRALLLDRLERAFVSCRKHGQTGALIFIDLDRFKTINDSLGHDVGDQMLQVIAGKLKAMLTGDATVARLGGDEFVFLLPVLSQGLEHQVDEVSQLAESILRICNDTHQVGSHELYMSCSVGITLFDGIEESCLVLMKRADTALYKAKEAGRNTFRFFLPEMQKYTDERLQMEKKLHHAMDSRVFDIYFQPQNGHEGELTGAEVLIRWQDEQGAFVPPAEFIPLAEEIGLINQIGEWVMESAFRQLAVWREQELWHDGQRLSINVSPLQFQHPDFVQGVEALLEKYQVAGDLIDLELTESMLVSDLDAGRARMERIRNLGINLSIDDFGTGYSSLQYLKTLPIDRVKVDQSFVRDLLEDESDAAIVDAVVAMAHALGLDVIAEGVESAAHVNRLGEVGCFSYQGYHFGRPMPAEQFARQCLA